MTLHLLPWILQSSLNTFKKKKIRMMMMMIMMIDDDLDWLGDPVSGLPCYLPLLHCLPLTVQGHAFMQICISALPIG